MKTKLFDYLLETLLGLSVAWLIIYLLMVSSDQIHFVYGVY